MVKELGIIQATQSLLNLPIQYAFVVNPRLHLGLVSDFLLQPSTWKAFDDANISKLGDDSS